MIKDKYGNLAQAFPIHGNTFAGVPTNQPCAGMLLHSSANGDITFHFATGDITGDFNSGSYVIVGRLCTGVTSTKKVVIS